MLVMLMFALMVLIAVGIVVFVILDMTGVINKNEE